MKFLNAVLVSFILVASTHAAQAQITSLTPPAQPAVPTQPKVEQVAPKANSATPPAPVVQPVQPIAPVVVEQKKEVKNDPAKPVVAVPPPVVVTDAKNVTPEDQSLSQVTNKEIFDKFKKSVTPVKINETSEPFKIEYEIPRKTLKKDLSEVSKDLKFKVGEKSPKEDANLLVQEAYKASLSGQLEASIALYKKALVNDQRNTNLLFALASLYHKLMQYAEARGYYKKLLALDPNYKKAMNNYLALVAEETPSMALQELLEIEKVNPEYSPVIAQIGMIYSKVGDNTKAEMYLRKAVTISPEVAAYRYNLAVVYDQMQRYTEAMTLYRQILDTGYTYEILPQSRAAIKERVDYIQTKISIQPTEK